MRKYGILLAVCLVALLSGCGGERAEAPVTTVTTAAVETAQTGPAQTEPVETPETQSPTVPTEPERTARQIREGVHFLTGAVDRTDVLSDGEPRSRVRLSAGEERCLRVSAEEAFAGLYLSWDELPGIYALRWDGGTMEAGGENFLHDYIRLPQAVRELEIVLSKDTLLCDGAVFTEGTAPEGVQDWLPPLDAADILVFPTHADDDTLFFGPLMNYYAVDRGLDVQTAFMVDHKYQPERAHERLNGLWELGIRHYPILGGAPDTATHSFQEAMSIYARSDILSWQVEQIRRFRPLVIVGHDLNGEYGNGGHKVNAHFLTQAVEKAGDTEFCPNLVYGPWDAPKLYLHLYEENRITLDVNTPRDMQGRSPFEAAQDAFRHHKSQDTGYLQVCQEDRPDFDCRIFGLYRTLVGCDTGADIMENVVKEQWR